MNPNTDPIHWRIYAAIGGDVLMPSNQVKVLWMNYHRKHQWYPITHTKSCLTRWDFSHINLRSLSKWSPLCPPKLNATLPSLLSRKKIITIVLNDHCACMSISCYTQYNDVWLWIYNDRSNWGVRIRCVQKISMDFIWPNNRDHSDSVYHDDVIKWKHFPRYWPFVRGIHRSVLRSFDAFFDLRLNGWLSKQSWGWWFGTPSRRLWRHSNGNTRDVSSSAVVLYHQLCNH